MTPGAGARLAVGSTRHAIGDSPGELTRGGTRGATRDAHDATRGNPHDATNDNPHDATHDIPNDRASTRDTGHGSAFGAITILNATATGKGCSLAVAAGSHADWTWRGTAFQCESPGADDGLARAVFELLRPTPKAAAVVRTSSSFPPARGLKTSSSVGAALVQAALRGLGQEPSWQDIASSSVQAARSAGVTITGAYDDQVAVLRGGAHLTDNAAQRILQTFDVPAWHVAVWIPAASVPKAKVAALDTGALRPELEKLAQKLRVETIPAALTANGEAFHKFYRAHGLPVDDRPTTVALEAGALGAGLSGTGPAVAALFEEPTTLPEVAGGTWTWTRGVPVQP